MTRGKSRRAMAAIVFIGAWCAVAYWLDKDATVFKFPSKPRSYYAPTDTPEGAKAAIADSDLPPLQRLDGLLEEETANR